MTDADGDFAAGAEVHVRHAAFEARDARDDGRDPIRADRDITDGRISRYGSTAMDGALLLTSPTATRVPAKQACPPSLRRRKANV
jgi:hypothetical protein